MNDKLRNPEPPPRVRWRVINRATRGVVGEFYSCQSALQHANILHDRELWVWYSVVPAP